MSRRKGRKSGKRRPQRPGGVSITIAGGRADGMQVRIPGVTSADYRRVQAAAEAGDVQAPEIMQFIRAFAEMVGVDLDAAPWVEADTWGFLKWLGFVDESAWTGLEDAELALLLQGEGADDDR